MGCTRRLCQGATFGETSCCSSAYHPGCLPRVPKLTPSSTPQTTQVRIAHRIRINQYHRWRSGTRIVVAFVVTAWAFREHQSARAPSTAPCRAPLARAATGVKVTVHKILLFHACEKVRTAQTEEGPGRAARVAIESAKQWQTTTRQKVTKCSSALYMQCGKS